MTGVFSEAAEATVLGAIMLDPPCLQKIQATNLGVDDFFVAANANIYRAMLCLAERDAAISPVTISEEMRVHSTIDDSGGIEYVVSLLGNATTSAYAPHHANILVELSNRRKMVETGAAMATMAPTAPTNELIEFAERNLQDVLARSRHKKGTPSMHEIMRAVFKQIEEMYANPQARGIPSGFVQIDSMLGNLRPAQFIVVGARPGVGKTSWLLNVTLNVASIGRAVGFFSLEMAADELVRRMLSMKSGVDHMRLLNAQVYEKEWPDVIAAASKLCPLPIIIEDAAMTLAEMRQRMRFMVKEQKCELICVDYLQLVKNKGSSAAREREVAEVSAAMKEMAKDLRVPIIALAQLNRSMENRSVRRPQLSDLRESGSIEQDADFVGFIHREPAAEVVADRAKAEFIGAKNRHGPTGTILLKFQPELTCFTEDDNVPA